MASAAIAMTFIATAYSWGCGAEGFTYTERIPHHERTIAVDPKVIPLYSLVVIEGFEGYRAAEDIGSAIKGNRIDIFMASCEDAIKFGRREVKVRLLYRGKGK